MQNDPLLFVVVTFQFSGIHSWPDCPIEQVGYLRHPHRHEFHVKAHKAVMHADRDVEIIRLKEEMQKVFQTETGEAFDLGTRSCEQIAKELVYRFELYSCEVLEDGENGAVFVEPKNARACILSETPSSVPSEVDASSSVRDVWFGEEVEGSPFYGANTVFVANASKFSDAVQEAHTRSCVLYLCPPATKRFLMGGAEVLDEAVAHAKRLGLYVTVAVTPKELPLLSHYVKASTHIMLDIDCPEIAEAGLAWKDMTVKVISAPYHTMSVFEDQAHRTSPSDYRNDSIIS